MSSERPSIRFTIATTVACVWAVAVISLVVVKAADVFLLSVLGVLLAVFLTRISRELSRRTGIGYGASVAVVTSGLLLANVGVVYLFGRQIETRLSQAASHADEVADEIRQWMHGHPVAQTAISGLPFFGRLFGEDEPNADAGSAGREGTGPPSTQRSGSTQAADDRLHNSTGPSAAERRSLDRSSLGIAWTLLSGLFRTTFGIVMNLAVVLFVGVFLAIEPSLYQDGVARLFPPKQRRRVGEILDQLGLTLWHWLLGRFASMFITGLGTAIALAVIGVPLPWMLGLLTGLLTFIPNLGAAIGLAMAVLVSLPEGGTTTLLVIFVFLAFQFIESYVLTPLIQRHQVQIPPAVLIVWQVLLGILAGMLGIFVSTPILAMIFVIVKGVYLDESPGHAEAIAAES